MLAGNYCGDKSVVKYMGGIVRESRVSVEDVAVKRLLSTFSQNKELLMRQYLFLGRVIV